MADPNNNRNPDSTLYRRLTRLFSGPIVNRRTQFYRQEKRSQLDKYKFKSASGQNFKKAAYNPFDGIQSHAMQNQNRGERYSDFDQMEYTPELASALDIYADEMTTHTSFENMLTVKCSNEEIKSVLETLYNKVLNVEFNLFGWCRTMCKYGDFFLYLDIDEGIGVKSVVGLPPHEIERLEGEDQTNPNYVQFQWNSGGLTFENWQIAHFRILGNDKYSPYGTSVLEPARRIWRQLTLLEDAMMAYRIVRAPDRRVFYIDVGAIAPEDVEQYMQKVITQMKRNQVIDKDTGRVDLRYNPMSIEEDYFLPVRGGSTNTRIENLPGGTFTGDIDDVKYLRDKLFSAIKIPQSYLSRGEGADEDKTTLSQKDIRFARTIQRLQRAVVAELEKIGIIHLYIMGFRGDDLISHSLKLNNPSKLAELQELEQWRTKFDVASAATQGYFSKRWVSENIFGMTDDDFLRNQREMFGDAKIAALLEATATLPEPGAAPAGGMGGLPDDEGGELEDMAAEPAAGEEDVAPETPEPEADLPAEPEEGDLLSSPPPARRDDKVRKYKKSTYVPVKYDNRKLGANKRKRKGEWNNEATKNTDRNTWRSGKEMLGLTQAIYREEANNYSTEEDKVFEVREQHREVKMLIEQLEKRDEKDETQEEQT
jgi:hypothetical protein